MWGDDKMNNTLMDIPNDYQRLQYMIDRLTKEAYRKHRTKRVRKTLDEFNNIIQAVMRDNLEYYNEACDYRKVLNSDVPIAVCENMTPVYCYPEDIARHKVNVRMITARQIFNLAKQHLVTKVKDGE